jgi:hypothetical protein
VRFFVGAASIPLIAAVVSVTASINEAITDTLLVVALQFGGD